MKFESILNQGVFQKRYKRFFVDIEFKDRRITAHCPNTGSMMGLREPGQLCLFSTNKDPKRKLKYTLEMVKTPKSWVGINTGRPNKLAMELFYKTSLKHWKNFDRLQTEVKISNQSRIDLVLWNSKDHENIKWNDKNLNPPLHLIEVKNVTLAENGQALFPDAVTTRGQKHLEELTSLSQKGYDCEMLFVIQRSDCQSFGIAHSIDPDYAKKLKEAKKAGVKITALPCKMNKEEIVLSSKALPLEL